MEDKKDLLAFCGFYCGDCLGYTGVIADASEGFKAVLDRYKFNRTIECVFPERLMGYGRLYEMVKFMADLRCPAVCRRRRGPTGASTCPVKNCCLEHGFYACYECDDFETCDRLRSLHRGLHAESCLKNMRSIREMGLEAWLDGGKRFRYWDDA